ncbi:MAG: FkbM family methyltransferase [Candidatus Aminicenantes bacterium]|nr:FkbM family methyltransferase [Candidatus Aminicenantes bacterium]
MAVKFYSQNGEDYLLWHFFQQKQHGFYIDIGAFDGIHLSNSFTFEQMGWRGICVEANPEMFAICRRNRPGSLCLNKACIGYDGKNPINERREQGKIDLFVDEMGLLTTTVNSKEKFDDIEKRYKKRGLQFSGLEKIEIETITFDEIMGKYCEETKEIDFVSIDTEGSELDILSSMNFESCDMRVLLIEYEKGTELQTAALLQERGAYSLARKTPHNMVFVKKREDLEMMKNIKIDCMIEKQVHPKGRKFTIPSFLSGKRIVE